MGTHAAGGWSVGRLGGRALGRSGGDRSIFPLSNSKNSYRIPTKLGHNAYRQPDRPRQYGIMAPLLVKFVKIDFVRFHTRAILTRSSLNL